MKSKEEVLQDVLAKSSKQYMGIVETEICLIAMSQYALQKQGGVSVPVLNERQVENEAHKRYPYDTADNLTKRAYNNSKISKERAGFIKGAKWVLSTTCQATNAQEGVKEEWETAKERAYEFADKENPNVQDRSDYGDWHRSYVEYLNTHYTLQPKP